MEIIREKLENGKTRAWVKRTPEEIAELKKKIEEYKKQLSNDISRQSIKTLP